MNRRVVLLTIGILALVLVIAVALTVGTRALRKPATPVEPAATVNGETISMSAFEERLLDEFGQPILLEQVQDVLIAQEAARRGIEISDEELDANISSWAADEIRQQQQRVLAKKSAVRSEDDGFWLALKPDSAESQTQAIEFIASPQELTVEEFRKGFRQQMMLEKMVREDMKLKPHESPSDAQIDEWLIKVKKRARIRGWRTGLPPTLAAVVNGQEIPVSSVMRELNERLAHGKAEEILYGMIDREIIRQKLEGLGESVSEEEIDREVARFRGQLRQKREFADISLETWLRSHGQSMEGLRDEFAWRIALAKIAAKDIPEEELRRAFQAAIDVYSGKKVRASHIFIAAIDPQTKKPKGLNAFEDALKKIGAIRQRLLAGADFADLAQRYSDEYTARAGGDLGFFPRTGTFVEEISAAAFELQKGQISEPVKTKNGYHILKVTDIDPGESVTFEEFRDVVLLDYVLANREAILKKYREESQIETFIEGIGRKSPGTKQ